MKRDFLLGGTKLPTGGAVRGAGGAMSPPVFMLKEALSLGRVSSKTKGPRQLGAPSATAYRPEN